MANDEHVALLKQGVAAWNAWRHENPDVRPELIGADLKRWNLTGANLSRANLVRARLRDVILNGANLFQAGLIGAKCCAPLGSLPALLCPHLSTPRLPSRP